MLTGYRPCEAPVECLKMRWKIDENGRRAWKFSTYFVDIDVNFENQNSLRSFKERKIVVLGFISWITVKTPTIIYK